MRSNTRPRAKSIWSRVVGNGPSSSRLARPWTADQTAISNAINARLSEFGLSNASVTYTIESINSIQTGHIQASYVQTYSIPFIRTFDMTYSSQAYVPVGS